MTNDDPWAAPAGTCAPCWLDRGETRTATHVWGGPEGLADEAAIPVCDSCADEARPFVGPYQKLTPLLAAADAVLEGNDG